MALTYLMFYFCIAFIISFSQNFTNPSYPPQIAAALPITVTVIIGLICLFNFVIGPFWTGYNTVAAARLPYGSDARLEMCQKALNASPLGKYQIRIFFTNQWLTALQNPSLVQQLTPESIQKHLFFKSKN